mgnify:FL=1|jgi:type I restriction enzyme S subunit
MGFKIEDIAAVKGGKRLPKGHELIDSKTQHPYIRARDIRNGKVNFNEPKYIDEDTFQRISRYIVSQGDVIITIVGANIGDVAYVNSIFHNANLTENAVKISADQNTVYSKYLFYYLNHKDMKQYFQLVASGAAQGKLGLYKIKKTPVDLPPLPTQQKIAKILSNYDDLIENNLKRIKLLEESARLTYEEWFLRFRVDGKKLDIDAATNLPFGWEYSGLNNISTFTNGYAFKSKDFVEYGHPVIKIKNIDGKMVDVHNTNRISANDVLKVNDKFKLHEGDLLIAMTGATVGKLGFVPYSNDACYLNQRVGKIQSEYLFFTFLALSGTSGQKQILNFAGGAAQPNISGDQILAVKNIIPAKDILDKFELLSNNALSQILNFTRKNQLLKEARDILLPRLMTGMIDTDDMDIAV